MSVSRSMQFFDRQFEQQLRTHDLALNPFEQMAMPHLRGQVLDFGCGMGELAVAAAQAGCSVVAIDGSEVAVEHLRRRAAAEHLKIDARRADLRHHELSEDFDSIVSIGLLMFFDCDTARRSLAELQARLRVGGTMVVNVLVEGTTFMDMFDADSHCLFARDELVHRFSGWEVIASEFNDFAAPGGTTKSFSTVVARKRVGAQLS